MSQILGSGSYLKITTGALNYSADYVAVLSLNNDGETELSDCDAVLGNPVVI